MNAIGTQLLDPINSGLVQWRLKLNINAGAEFEWEQRSS